MATKTGSVIYRPSADKSLAHNVSSGSKGYSMLSEASQDGDSTYVYQSLTSTSNATKKSTFTMSPESAIPEGATVTSVKLHVTARDSDDNVTATFTSAVVIGGSEKSVIGSTTLTTSYKEYTGSLTVSGDAENVAVAISTSGKKGSSKDDSGYIRVTQVYLEVNYSYETTPVITVDAPSKTAISDESGHDECICTFSASLSLTQWEARATKKGNTPARGVGLLVESGGALARGAKGTVSVVDEELTDGDGEYQITVYGKATTGEWSS